ncbi:MAG TPA: response regulator [Deltaproteobacteria bacterium]|nr:response regulator [Deltaproteobacteria bacterium]
MEAKKILVIDDEAPFVNVVKRIIESRSSYRVFTATDGQTGLKLARSEKPDLILLDIVMPGMSGSDVAEDLLEDPLTRDIPIIFVTAVISKDEIGGSGGMLGNRTFIAKPIVADELMAKINKLFSQ